MFPFQNTTMVQSIHADSLTDLTINQPEAHHPTRERAPGIIQEPEMIAHERSSFVHATEINDPWGNSLLDHLKYLANFNGANIQPIPQEQLQKLNRINAKILNNFYSKCSNASRVGGGILGCISFSTYSQDSLFQVVATGASIVLAVSGLFLSETFDGWQKSAFERAMREKAVLFSKVAEIYHNLAKKLVEEYVHNMHSSSNKGFRAHMPSHKRMTAQIAIRISKGIVENIDKIKEGLFNIKLHNLDNDKIILSTENRLNDRLYLGNPYRNDQQSNAIQHAPKGCYLSYKYLCCFNKCRKKEDTRIELECLKQERDQEINDIIIRLYDAAKLILHLSSPSKNIEDRELIKNSMKEYYCFLEEYKKSNESVQSSTPPGISPANRRRILSATRETKENENESDEISSVDQSLDIDDTARGDNSQVNHGVVPQRKKRSLKWTTDSHRQSHSSEVQEAASVDVNELGNDMIVDIESKLGAENSAIGNYRGPRIHLFDLVNTTDDIAEIERIYRARFGHTEKEYTEEEIRQIISDGSIEVRRIMEDQQAIKKRRNEFVKWDICYKEFLAKKFDKPTE